MWICLVPNLTITAEAAEVSVGTSGGESMGTSAAPNVIAFPLGRSEQLKPSRQVIKFENGKFVACNAPSAELVTIADAQARLKVADAGSEEQPAKLGVIADR
jgi:hypothetical protein